MRLHERGTLPSLDGWDGLRAGWYFITACTHHRRPFFGEVIGGEMRMNRMGELVAWAWNEIPRHGRGLRLGEFVVMPDHVHGLLYHPGVIALNSVEGAAEDGGSPSFAPGGGARYISPLHPERRGAMDAYLVSQFLGRFKAAASRRMREEGLGMAGPIWQRNSWTRWVRGSQRLSRIERYIRMNPVAWEAKRARGLPTP